MKSGLTATEALPWLTRVGIVFAFFAATAMGLSAQTFTTLYSFDGVHGAEPWAALVQTTNGHFYGTTTTGGGYGRGAVFEITARGELTTLHSFCFQSYACADGSGPFGLVQATDGNLYGTTSFLYNDYGGVVFKMALRDELTPIYSFCSQSGCTDGDAAEGTLVQASDGNFYGTTSSGGAHNAGTVYEITPSGNLTTLYSFCVESGCTDGKGPYAGLVQASDGNFYGTTEEGGANTSCESGEGCGTVYRITPTGELTTLYSFGSQSRKASGDPAGGLIQGANGDLYGTTVGGGANGSGSVFEITLGGALSTLYSFCAESSCVEGFGPSAGLIQGTDGNFYGTTASGPGTSNSGAVFQMTPSGVVTPLYNFCSQNACADGAEPFGGLVQGTDGDFYGTTLTGGTESDGTVFRVSVGLGPFVKAQPSTGGAGAVVEILGTHLTGTTSVTFNGIAAVFHVNPTGAAITTEVPAGATTGTIEVVTPGGTLSSYPVFTVIP